MGDMDGLYLTEVDVPPKREFARERLSVDQHVDYITDATANQTCREVLNWLLNLEAGAVIPTNEVDNSAGGDLEELFYVPIQLGFQYRF